jgi:hypothetical protein
LVDTCTTNLDMVPEPPSAATVADAVWDEAATGHTDAGKAGAQMWTDVDAILADTGTDGVVVATNNDKTGYSIGAGGIPIGAFEAGAVTDAAVAADAETAFANAVKAAVIESQGSITLQQALSIILSVLAGVTADGGATFKSSDGSATRVSATINASNERTAMTLTPST